MQNNVNTNVERIIAKIDNDFNPDNSDWIPRVGAWCIDAMSQLNVLRTKTKKIKLVVRERIAYSNCHIDNKYIRVYDKNGCEIKEANSSNYCCNPPSTGESTSETSDTITSVTPDTIDLVDTGKQPTANHVVAETINDKYSHRYNIHHYISDVNINKERNYVLINCNKIELNFDTDFIYVETKVIETYHSNYYHCELPVIPNNGILIEAIAYYCMYKMLCRGYKHPVFNLNASQYGTNPYYQWSQLKDQASRSVINDIIDNTIDDGSSLFRSNLFIDTFNPRK